MKKLTLTVISLLLILCMMSCNNIQNFPEDTVDDTVESTKAELKEEPNEGFLNYDITFEYETISEFLDFIENMGKPEWYVSPYEFSYIGELSKVTVYGPFRFTDNLTFEEFDKKAMIRYYFEGYEDMFFVEIRKVRDIWWQNHFADASHFAEESVVYWEYSSSELFFEGVENVNVTLYDYYESWLSKIDFVAGNTEVRIWFDNHDKYVGPTKFIYDMSNEEINKFLYKSTLPYALEIMGNVCIYGEEQKYYNIPEEYR